jgi:hypothetical protein
MIAIIFELVCLRCAMNAFNALEAAWAKPLANKTIQFRFSCCIGEFTSSHPHRLKRIQRLGGKQFEVMRANNSKKNAQTGRRLRELL